MIGFLKNEPALPKTAGSGSLDWRILITASLTSLYVLVSNGIIIIIIIHTNIVSESCIRFSIPPHPFSIA